MSGDGQIAAYGSGPLLSIQKVREGVKDPAATAAVPGTEIQLLALNRDGSLLVSADSRGTVRLWRAGDSSTLVRLAVLEDGPGSVTGLGFGPDGSLYVGREDGSVSAFDTDPAVLVERICSAPIETSPRAVWDALVPGVAYPAGCP